MSFTILNHADGPTAYFYAGSLNGVQNFGWINIFGLITVILLLLPNIIYAIKHKGERNLCENRFMNILEQAGRYGSMLFMVVCLKEGGYGFSSLAAFLIYCFGNLLLVVTYWVVWGVYFAVTKPVILSQVDGPTAVFTAGKPKREGVAGMKMALAILPSCLFLLDGITLEYTLLVIFAALFAIGHIYVTCQNIKEAKGNT